MRDAYIVQKLPGTLYKLNFPEKIDEYKNFQLNIKPKTTRKKYEDVKSFFSKLNWSKYIVRLLIDNEPDAIVLIDKEDYDKIKNFKYWINQNRVQNNDHILSRFLMNETDPNVLIDHIDGNHYNNTKVNLRRSDTQKNSENKSKTKSKTTSKYIGVSFSTEKQRWKAVIYHKGKNKYIGSFRDEVEAAKARDRYIIENLPDSHYKLNFPELKEKNVEGEPPFLI